MGSRKELEEEDLAIQDTLSMTVEARLELLANLIVDKIVQDQKNDSVLLNQITRLQNA